MGGRIRHQSGEAGRSCPVDGEEAVHPAEWDGGRTEGPWMETGRVVGGPVKTQSRSQCSADGGG